MTSVWEKSRSKNGARLVLLALADFSDDSGRAYPSVSALSRKTNLCERAVQAGLKELVDLKELSVSVNAGKRGCNYYTITMTPADSAPPQILHPDNSAPPQIIPGTPADSAPEPSGEPSITPPPTPTASDRTPPAAAGGGDDESEDEATKASRRAEIAAKKAVMERLGKPFRRRASTEWSDKEKKALGRLYVQPDFLLSVDEVEAYYVLPPTVFPKKPRSSEQADYRRHDLITQLNNWWGEVGKARKFFEANPQHRATIKRPNGDPLLSSEFLEWLTTIYPSAVGKKNLSDIPDDIRRAFRAACPGLRIAA